MKMNGGTSDTVSLYYSQRAHYPLQTLEADRITIAEPTGPVRCVLWMAVFPDRAVLVSSGKLAPSLRQTVKGRTPGDLMKPDSLADLSARCAAFTGGEANLRSYTGRKYCCDGTMLCAVHDANVRKLTSDNASAAIGRLRSVGIPDDAGYLLAEDTAFAYFLEAGPVAFAGTHPVGIFSDRIGDVMVGTLDAYRGRGFGKAVISATTEAVVTRDKVAVWGMSHDNLAAMRTASSVGYQQCCEVFELRRTS